MQKKEKRKITRRKLLFGLVASGIVAGAAIYPFVQDESPVTEENPNVKKSKLECRGLTIGDYDFKILGVRHTRRFAQAHYNTLSDLIKNCSVLVCEHSIEDIESSRLYTDFAKSYGKTLYNLCREHKKSVVHLDPGNFVADNIDGVVGAGASLVIAYELLRGFKRRELLRRCFRIGAAGYIAASSSFGLGVKGPLYYLGFNSYRYDHLSYGNSDYRNAVVAEGVMKLPELIGKPDIDKGDYILIEMGKTHFHSLVYYLKHPNVRRFKHSLYWPTYNAISSEKIVRFDFMPEKGGWEKQVLN